MRAFVLSCVVGLGGLTALSIPPVHAHSGHGDEFVQTDSVRQVEARSERDLSLGITTATPQASADGLLSVPTVAIIEVNGRPLVYVYSGSTYDPVFIRTGTDGAESTVVTEGISANEQIVVSGALSLYAESQKKGSITTKEISNKEPTNDEANQSQKNNRWLTPVVGVGVLALIIAAAFGLRGRDGGSKTG